jgi:predicted RNase H-like HicB family nuclease
MLQRFQDDIKKKNGGINVRLTLLGFEQDNLFVLYSPALDIYAYGDDQAEAKQAFDETIQLYLDHVREENSLDEDLRRLGWKKHTYFKKKFLPPKYDPRTIMSKKGVDSFLVVQNKELAIQA